MQKNLKFSSKYNKIHIFDDLEIAEFFTRVNYTTRPLHCMKLNYITKDQTRLMQLYLALYTTDVCKAWVTISCALNHGLRPATIPDKTSSPMNFLREIVMAQQ